MKHVLGLMAVVLMCGLPAGAGARRQVIEFLTMHGLSRRDDHR